MIDATEIIRMAKDAYEKLRLHEGQTTPNEKLLFAAARELERLTKQLATANNKILDYEQTEAAVCPEDMGAPEYIKFLKKQLAASEKEDGLTLEIQNRIRNFVVEKSGAEDATIDGSGCESGDPVDLTLDEIGQGFNYLFDEIIEPLQSQLTDAEETIKTKDIIIKQLNRRLDDIGAQC